jgi:hypothetical protein
MFYFDLYIINVYVILPPDLGLFAVNKYIHTYNEFQVRFSYCLGMVWKLKKMFWKKMRNVT